MLGWHVDNTPPVTFRAATRNKNKPQSTLTLKVLAVSWLSFKSTSQSTKLHLLNCR